MNKDIVGTRIGIYDVLYECNRKTNDGHRLYHVKCSICGFETDMAKRYIYEPKICKHVSITGRYIHGGTYKWNNKRLKTIFEGMKARCYIPTNKSYRWHGAKGIKICDEWLDNPLSFEEWSLANGYNDDLSIDRKNGNKNYCPENCRWITINDNSKYKSTTRKITVNNITHTGKDWGRLLGLSKNRINNYIRKYGIDKTKSFISKRMSALPIEITSTNPSYFNLYMKQVDDDGFIKLIPRKK